MRFRPKTWTSLGATATTITQKRILKLNEDTQEYVFYGEPLSPETGYPFDTDRDLTALTSWNRQGYNIDSFLPSHLFEQLHLGLTQCLTKVLQAQNIMPPPYWKMDLYHRLLPLNHPAEKKLQERLFQGFSQSELPIDLSFINDRISTLCGQELIPYHPELPKIFMLRVVRPGSHDHNDPHRDVWLDCYRNAINIYVPLAGSNENSSLPLIPGSHHWTEEAVEQFFGGQHSQKPYQMIRPNPQLNEVLIFSPYLIHGGAINKNLDQTRISLEMRFWPKSRITV